MCLSLRRWRNYCPEICNFKLLLGMRYPASSRAFMSPVFGLLFFGNLAVALSPIHRDQAPASLTLRSAAASRGHWLVGAAVNLRYPALFCDLWRCFIHTWYQLPDQFERSGLFSNVMPPFAALHLPLSCDCTARHDIVKQGYRVVRIDKYADLLSVQIR